MANTPKLLEAFTTIQSEIYRYEVEKEQWEQEKTSYQVFFLFHFQFKWFIKVVFVEIVANKCFKSGE